jgi:uncharacterized protein YndB with AHSA1/START domain
VILKIAICIVVIIAAILTVAATKPNTFRIKRSIAIKAPPQKIFALIDDFRNWSEWAPQDKEDPTMSRTYNGPESGKGAICIWNGSGSSGRGQMAITDSVAPSRIVVTVDFVKPFAAHNINDFALEAAGDSTNVTWEMHGTNVYVMKVISIFVNMDRVMGKHFETGLRNLKDAAEK